MSDVQNPTNTSQPQETQDLAGLIAKAMSIDPYFASTPSQLTEFVDGKDEFVGEVPPRLRALLALCEQIDEQATAAEELAHRVRQKAVTVKRVFFDSLKDHVPSHVNYDALGVRQNYQVVGRMVDEEVLAESHSTQFFHMLDDGLLTF
jgi:hypothetical protein